MKIIQVEKFGGPEVLTCVEVPNLQPKENEVLISVEASGVGTVDVMMRKGMYPGLPEIDFIPGIEIAGTIKAVGTDVDKELLDRRVFAITQTGGYAQELTMHKDSVVLLPDNISFIEAVSLGVNALVAYFSVQHAGLKKTDRLLVRGAGGGIGSLVVQIALTLGADVTAVPYTADKQIKLKELGVHQFYEKGDLSTGFDVIIDPVAGTELDSFVGLLNNHGKYILNGAAAGFPAPEFGMSWLQRFQQSLSLHCVSLSSFNITEITDALGKIFGLVKQGQITSLTAKVFPLTDAKDAHIYLESGSSFGKIVLANPNS